MRVNVWITIHLCSKELVDVSRMVRKISLKNTWGKVDETRLKSGDEVSVWLFISNKLHQHKCHNKSFKNKKQAQFLRYSRPDDTVTCVLYLNLHLQVDLEVGEQGEEDSQWELKDLGHRGDAILGQSHAQILFDGVDEHLVSAKHRPGALQHRQQQLQGDNLGPQLVGPAEERKCMGISDRVRVNTKKDIDTEEGYIQTCSVEINQA